MIDRKTMRLPPSQYFARVFPKDLIVLHFTAGQSARSAYDSWMSSSIEVATAYIVDANGTIYETFDPKYWGYHLGMPTSNPNHKHDRRSIGIEIANVGPLKKVGAYLNWWPKDYGTKWCSELATASYVKSPYRGFDYFAPFQDAQYDAVKALVGELCERFSIPKTLPPIDKRTECDLGYFAGYSGIAAHQNFRADKLDVGPAFDWGRVL